MRFGANMQDLERELKRLQQLNARAAQRMQDAHQRAAQQSSAAWRNTNFGGILTSQIASVGPALKGLAATIAATFAGNEALQAAERWQTFGNSLRVAGLEGSNLRAVQEQLYRSAIKNGVELGPLGELYGRLSQSANELGASQQQMLKFTNGITAALRVQGGPAEAASGALMQLSQAMAGGIVRAEEFNSINEGARPILEAVAAGWAKSGMTVSKLRAVMLEGKLTSQEFFAAFLNGSAMLETKAAKAPLTVAQGMTNLHTALTRAIGQTNEAYGVTERIGQAIKWVSENLDVLAKSIAVVGGLYLLTLAPAVGTAGAALAALVATKVSAGIAAVRLTAFNVAMTASMTGMSTAAVGGTMALTGLRTAMAFFGGPIGLAFLAISAAVAMIGVSSAAAALETEKLDRSIAEYTKRRQEAEAAENSAKVAQGELDAKQRAALESTASLTGQVDLLSTAYGRLAVEAKRARLEILATDVVRTGQEWQAKQRATRQIQGSIAHDQNNYSYDPLDRRTGAGRGAAQVQARIAQNSNDPRLVEARRQEAEARANLDYAIKQRREAKAADPRTFVPKPAAPPSPKPDKKKGAKAAKPRDISSASERAEEQAEKAFHQALWASAKTAEERHTYALEALEADKADKLAQLDRQVHDKDITAAAAERAKVSYEAAHSLEVANEMYRREQELVEERNRQLTATVDLSREALTIEAEGLEDQARYVTDIRVRHKLQREALAKRQRAEDEAFKLQQDQLALERQKAGWTQAVIDRLRQDAQRNHDAQKAGDNRRLDADQAAEQPKSIRGQLSDFAHGFGDLNTQLSDIAKSGIADLSRGMADAIVNAGSLQEAFENMAKSMISQLIEMGIRFAIFEAIGMAIGVPGLGKASLGIGPGVGRNALGTDNWGGGLTMVGEHGPELIGAPRGSQIVPNNLLRNAFAQGIGGGQGGGPNVTVNNNIHATDAVLTTWVKDEVNKGTVAAITASQKLSAKTNQQRAQNSLLR